MSEIVNLRRVKKARQKAEAALDASANRVRHGRTKGEREAERAETERAARALDGARVGEDET